MLVWLYKITIKKYLMKSDTFIEWMPRCRPVDCGGWNEILRKDVDSKVLDTEGACTNSVDC